MKLINFSFSLICIINFNITECAQAAQSSVIPTFTWTSHRKNTSGQDLSPDNDFAHLSNMLIVLSSITQETPAQNHWIFSSTNMPNFKTLKIQKTDPSTGETRLATYKMLIPADNNNHLETSIWGFNPYINTEAHIGLTLNTASRISQMFAQHDTQTSRALMPIIHCITTATFTYSPEQPRPVNPLPGNISTTDNRYRSEYVLVNPDGQTK